MLVAAAIERANCRRVISILVGLLRCLSRYDEPCHFWGGEAVYLERFELTSKTLVKAKDADVIRWPLV